jgi:hypothetical protein
MNNTFYFKSTASPTPFNLDKHLTKGAWRHDQPGLFSDVNLMLNPNATIVLEEKHRLAALAQQYAPSTMPMTLCLEEHTALNIINELNYNGPWILKPALLNNGEGIHIFENNTALLAHYQQTKRYGGPHVLQRYIHNPHLLQGHKYSLRMFCVITNYNGAYLYPKGYFNVAKEAYAPTQFKNLNAHLTNEHLNHESGANNWQIPSDRCPNFEVISQQIHQLSKDIMYAAQQYSPSIFEPHHHSNAFSLFGFDFMVDADMRTWLLEINHGPCFPKEDTHPLQRHLYNDFWRDIISDFVTPISRPCDHTVKQFLKLL